MAKRPKLRTIAEPFTVAAPTGARIRDRLRLSDTDAATLMLVGRHLGALARGDFAARLRIGDVPANQSGRAPRKQALTSESSSRWAGAITRTSEDQYRLAMRCTRDEYARLRTAVQAIRVRAGIPAGSRRGRLRGYADQNERWQKQR